MNKKIFLSLFAVCGLLWSSLTASAMEDETRDENLTQKARGSQVFLEDPKIDIYAFAKSVNNRGVHLSDSVIGVHDGKLFEIDYEFQKNCSFVSCATHNDPPGESPFYSFDFVQYNNEENKYEFSLELTIKNSIDNNWPASITFYDEVEGYKRKQEVYTVLGVLSMPYLEQNGGCKLSRQFVFPSKDVVLNLVNNRVKVFRTDNYFEHYSITLFDGLTYKISTLKDRDRFCAPIKICPLGCELKEGLKDMHWRASEICEDQGGPLCIYELFVDMTINCNKFHYEPCWENMQYYNGIILRLDLEAMGLTKDQVSVEDGKIMIWEKGESLGL